ncbi:UNVERIFIED_CONTAM: hypothetical protein Sangu_2182400 [Sesamum angustifolium]|uniref:Retrotransposon gag domain-containing protein n=1 Tax=Sesamum angustifolium TaxID=2727405 RepID=A0AAW2LIZ5_9LAMI
MPRIARSSAPPFPNALAWFNQLSAGTISSLKQLTQRFLHHLSMNKRVPKTAAFLFTIRQRENEPLRDYMQIFVEAVHEVPHVNHELLTRIIQQNLLPERFNESIADKLPSTMENLLMRSQKYIRIEESNASDPSLGVKRKGREEEKEPKKKEKCKHVPPIWFRHYTTLNASRGEILVVVEQQGLIHQWPRKMKDNPKRVKSKKYYRFHRDRGHTTEECHHLMNEIEKLIQRGYLKEYINQGPSRQPQDSISAQTRNTDNLLTAGVIAVISGGPTRGDSANARKTLARVTRENHWQAPIQVYNVNSENQEEISFNSQDMDPMRNQNNDALVNTPLTGFIGEMIEALGEVMLPLSLGSLPKRSTKMVKFLVVKAPSAYNIILGRPSLNLFRAIASTFHMKLKFPTSVGMERLWETN